MSILMIFVDGVGIGKNDPEINPFSRAVSRIFPLFLEDANSLAQPHPNLEDGFLKAIDCRMDFPGLPQSATGQTALFTGVNTAVLLGRHLSGFPNKQLKELLRKESIMVSLEKKGYRVVFANAFTPPYFVKKISRVSATTAMAEACSARIRNFDDLEKGGAVFMDLTNSWLIENGYWVTPRTVEEAGVVLASITHDYDFTLFEYFISDVIGHRGDMTKAVEQVRILDCLINAVWENLDHMNDLMIIASDHGNLEDVTLKSHSENWIPLIFAGKEAGRLIGDIGKITDVTPAILSNADIILERSDRSLLASPDCVV
jgi:2,3-bisphosphoglycerate-independent phosphoglycerate mutase